MSDRPEISSFMKWKEICEFLKQEAKDTKEVRREETRGLIAAILGLLGSTSDIATWKAMCDLLRKEGGKEASQEEERGLIAAILLLAAKK
ncbi:MAG: hypothetical protein ACE5R6_10340 [Candidatus Heimdallarchaeota archaeon]